MRLNPFQLAATPRRDFGPRWRSASASLLLLFLAARPAVAASPSAPNATSTNSLPTADFLVQRVVERSAWNEEKQIRNLYSFVRRHITDELNDKGQLKERKDQLYEVTPIGGVSHSKLVLKDGKPLSAKEEKSEAEKEKKAWAASTAGLKQPITPDKGRSINQDLVQRFRFEVVGEEVIAGRRTYALTMEPKSAKLPVHELQDHFFNKLGGRVWIDAQDYEVAKAEIALREKVPVVLNLIGAINKFAIHFRKRRLPEGVWLTDRSWVDMETRKLMIHSHVNHILEWRDFKAVGPIPTNFVPSSAQPPAPAPVKALPN